MSTPVYINEPIMVEARFTADGRVEPTAFVWGGRTRAVADTGRQWVERSEESMAGACAGADAVEWRCYLVHTANLETFELRFDPVRTRWTLARAWLNQTA